MGDRTDEINPTTTSRNSPGDISGYLLCRPTTAELLFLVGAATCQLFIGININHSSASGRAGCLYFGFVIYLLSSLWRKNTYNNGRADGMCAGVVGGVAAVVYRFS
jgi:hypothetical protein